MITGLSFAWGEAEKVPELSCRQVFDQKGQITVVDVRTPEEWNGELGHIEGAVRITLGESLTEYLKAGNKDQAIVFVCRSGARSAKATTQSIELGYKHTATMAGGMIRWNEEGLPVERK
ncbi:MAG: rhodanese-like domain-containing protein [Proteobacteria bacterium]|nr:rhodanese-like domain-containing protein [Pseudomonadota bacterium]NDC24259.1 rhodanese-like domain-containing protein [Pseudomonadota bacterium]NDD03280.1 rhodanese-like domain-containing protein [Pseudomonadota bacterium]